MNVPPNTDTYASAIEAILRRIPDGWIRALDVDPGWYPLVVTADAQLAALDPYYIVYQTKEKFGALRYYCAPRDEDPTPELLDAFDAITDRAERASLTTCERCGKQGTLHEARHRVKTLCPPCAETLGYLSQGAGQRRLPGA